MDREAATGIGVYLADDVSPTVRMILMHLCETEEPSYGAVIEWCEARGDCTQAVVCPHCGQQYVIEADEFAELQRLAAETDRAMACGVRFD